MIEHSFPLITCEDTAKNQNSQFGITLPVQLSMANGNTQFAIDMSKNMKISYTIPTVALQIAARFFHLRCYIHYDRFMIILACIVLAFKLKYMEFRFKDIIFFYLQIVNFRCQKNDLIDEHQVNKIKDEICVAENQVLRTLQYDIDIITPHEYLPRILQIAPLPLPPKNSKQQRIRLTTRILILDSNRTQCSLYFSPFCIVVACLLIACRYQGIKPYETTANKPTGQSIKVKNEQQLYSDWLALISQSEKQKLKQEEILECIKHMNNLFNLIAETHQ